MNDTIRDYIRRRVWWCAAFAVGGWLMFPLGAAIEPSLPDGVARTAVWIVGFIMFGGAILKVRLVRASRLNYPPPGWKPPPERSE